MGKKVLTGPWSASKPAPLPENIGELRPMHALLIAFEAMPNDRDAVIDRLVEEHGFSGNALAFAWYNSYVNDYIGKVFVRGIGFRGEGIVRPVWSVTDKGRTRLAQLNEEAARTAPAGQQGSLFGGSDG